MWASFATWIGSIGSVILGIVIKDIFSWATSYVNQLIADKKQHSIANDNVKKDADALKSGDLDAIAKASENLLNGNSSKP